jgi:hypothetical protein
VLAAARHEMAHLAGRSPGARRSGCTTAAWRFPESARTHFASHAHRTGIARRTWTPAASALTAAASSSAASSTTTASTTAAPTAASLTELHG